MRSWCKILPYCFIEWYAKRHCETYRTFGTDTTMTIVVVEPFKGTIIEINK